MKRYFAFGFMVLAMAFVAWQPTFAQREQAPRVEKLWVAPKLVFKKSRQEVPGKRQSTYTERLVDQKDKTQAIDFKLEHIDVGPDLQMIKKEWQKDNKLVLVIFENKGTWKSKEAYLFVQIKALMSVKESPASKTETRDVVLAYGGQVISEMEPKAQRPVAFDFSKNQNIAYFSKYNIYPGSGPIPYYQMLGPMRLECILVTEPIDIQ